jgi:predicted ArsR family transcriptional regulator
LQNTLPFAGHTQNSLLHSLMRSETPLSLDELSTELGITKTAARQHVLGLQKNGFVQTTDPDPSTEKRRGRPTFTYELTARGKELFTRHYQLFSQKMILLMKDMLDEKAFKRQMQEMGKMLAQDYAHAVSGPKQKNTPSLETLEQLAALMRELGYDAARTGDNEITAHNCVFHQLAENCENVCEVDLAFMKGITGQKPAHTECMVRGGKTCRFKF